MPPRVLVFISAFLAPFYLFLISFYPTVDKTDRELLIKLLESHNDFLDASSLVLQQFGSQILWLAVALIFFISGRKVWGLTLIVGLALDAVVENSLKIVVGRPRPKDVMVSFRIIDAGLGPSFPSGHASRAFLASVLFGNFYPRLKALWYAVAGLSALARIYLGAHFPTDVLAGTLNGILLGYIVLELTKTRSFHRLVGIQIQKG